MCIGYACDYVLGGSKFLFTDSTENLQLLHIKLAAVTSKTWCGI